jgi:hypothetical protein
MNTTGTSPGVLLLKLSDEYTSSHNLRVEDSFANGVFLVEVSVTSDEGPYKISKLLVTVDTDWRNLRMRKMSRLARLRAS